MKSPEEMEAALQMWSGPSDNPEDRNVQQDVKVSNYSSHAWFIRLCFRIILGAAPAKAVLLLCRRCCCRGMSRSVVVFVGRGSKWSEFRGVSCMHQSEGTELCALHCSGSFVSHEPAQLSSLREPGKFQEECAVCLLASSMPLQLPCGHSFCGECVEPWLRRCGSVATDPVA